MEALETTLALDLLRRRQAGGNNTYSGHVQVKRRPAMELVFKGDEYGVRIAATAEGDEIIASRISVEAGHRNCEMLYGNRTTKLPNNVRVKTGIVFPCDYKYSLYYHKGTDVRTYPDRIRIFSVVNSYCLSMVTRYC